LKGSCEILEGKARKSRRREKKTSNDNKPKGNPQHTPPREVSPAVMNRKTPRNAIFLLPPKHSEAAYTLVR